MFRFDEAMFAANHAINNPGHVVDVRLVTYLDGDGVPLLQSQCQNCEWWDESGLPEPFEE